jgi:putative Mn2+ efflux pump MntP
MSIITIIALAIGLSMDAFAVSITSGLTMKVMKIRYALRIALFFGLFQTIMPILGYLAGLSIRRYIESFDHWIAFGLLSAIGIKMIYESFSLDKDEKSMNPDDLFLLLILAIATSIDALAVGLSISLLKVDIIKPAVIIGIITFAISFGGVILGRTVGHLFEKKIEILGGLILIGIGLKILLGHLLA